MINKINIFFIYDFNDHNIDEIDRDWFNKINFDNVINKMNKIINDYLRVIDIINVNK